MFLFYTLVKSTKKLPMLPLLKKQIATVIVVGNSVFHPVVADDTVVERQKEEGKSIVTVIHPVKKYWFDLTSIITDLEDRITDLKDRFTDLE